MLLQHEKKDVTVAGAQENAKMSIEMNAKAFELMTDRLYQNKIGSIVREISSNAYDSHVDAGKPDEPFHIHLPDQLEPWFAVQDFGVGLSPQSIYDIYGKLMKSTKDQSNNSLGAFGLGSKTPFAYNSSFTVTSVFDGVMYHYSVHLDEVGTPTISLMDSNETDDGNGFTVRIPVKQEDYSEFRSETARQLKFFTVKPKIKNCGHFVWNELPKATMTIGDVELLNQGYSAGVFAIQGGVGYKLDTYEVRKRLSDENYDAFKLLTDNGARINFAIGDLQVTASREAIEYKEYTLKNIDAKLNEFRTNMEKEFNSIMASKANDWERACFLNGNATMQSIARIIDYKIANTYSTGRSLNFTGGDVFGENIEKTYKKDDGTEFTQDVWHRYFKIVYYRKNNSGNISMRTSHDVNILPANSNIDCLFYRDTNKQPIARIKNHMKENGMDEMYVLVVGSDNVNAPEDAFTKKALKTIKTQFGGIELSPVSDMAKPAKPIKQNVSYDKPAGYVVKSNRAHILEYKWDNTYDWGRAYGALEDLEPSVYVECDRYDVLNSDHDLMQKYRSLAKAGLIDDMPLYGFNKVNTAKIKDMDDWMTLQEFIDQEYHKMGTLYKKFYRLAKLYSMCDFIERKIHENDVKKIHNIELLDKGSFGHWFFKALFKLPKWHKKQRARFSYKDLDFFYEHKQRIISDISESLNESEMLNKIKDGYKMFQLVPTGSYYGSIDNDDQLKHIIQYVNCMSKGA